MTRFARAKGSKASNERVAEDATSWAEMKQQLKDKKEAVETAKKQQQADAKRKENYDKFLEDVKSEESKNNQWADFPVNGSTHKPKKEKKRKDVIINAQVDKLDDANISVNNGNDNEQETNSSPKKNAKKRKIKTDASGNTDVSVAKKKKDAKVSEEVRPPKKAVEEMTEEERNKFEKKKAKKLKQLEKRKMKKQQLKEQQAIEKQAMDINDKDENGKQVVHNNNNNNNTNKPGKQMKTPQKVKKFDANKEHKRRKPQEDGQTITINGKEVELAYYNGFPIKREDAERLTELRKQMISKGLPRSEVKAAIKLERRRAEKALARDKKNVCYNCRQSGHVLSECPAISANGDGNVETAGVGICFKCGSTEHTSFVCKVVKSQEFRFASCFICKEQGHISWQCPDNARGLYPKGGACKLCGDVTHLKKDCPKYVAEQEANTLSLDTFVEGSNPDSLEVKQPLKMGKSERSNKIIKF